jgi:16S rRNA G1207 methylase RsmC
LLSATQPDRGSLAMLSLIRFEPNDKVLDLGCGYGPDRYIRRQSHRGRTCVDGGQRQDCH